jgi:catechol 2,3-dioxygenase-like lactoylglutathione lyase family enzyme
MPDTLDVRFHHVGLSVADLDAQERWYRDVLGLTKETDRVDLPDPGIRAVILEGPTGVCIELIERQGAVRSRIELDPMEVVNEHGYAHWAMTVGDLEAVFARVTEAGAEVIWPPGDSPVPGARFAFIKDPEGNGIELIQPAPHP